MVKKALLAVILLIVMILAGSTALAVKNINITDSEVVVTGTGGEKTGEVNVMNTGNESVNVTLDSTILLDDAGHSLELSGFSRIQNLQPGSTAQSTFTADLDNNAGNYTGIITADAEGVSDSVMVRVEIKDNKLDMSVPSSIIDSTKADEEFKQVIEVNNRRNKDVRGVITKSGYDGLSFSVDKEGPYVFPALSKTKITSTVGVPAGAKAGAYTGKVKIVTDSKNYTTTLQTLVENTYKADVAPPSISVDPGSSSSGNIKITNKGNVNLTGLSIINIPQLIDDDGDEINITVSPNSSIDVNVGETKTVSLKASASPKMDSGDHDGTMKLSGTGISKEFSFTVNVRDILQISDLDISDDDIKVGEKFDIDVEVENIAGEIDLEDVEIKVYLVHDGSRLEDDDGDDIEDESERFDLDAEDYHTVTFDFKLPYHLSDGDKVKVHIEATGENAEDSSEEYKVVDESLEITAEKEDHELEFYRVKFDADTLSCSRSTYLRVGVRNIGDNDEDDVELAVENAELGISKHEIFDLSNDPDDDEFEEEKSFLLNLEDAPTGTYEMRITVYYDDDDEKEVTTATLEVKDCVTTTPDTGDTGTSGTEEEEQVNFTYSGGKETTAPSVTAKAVSPKITSTRDSGDWTDSAAFLGIVGAANVLLLIMIVLAVVYLVKK